MLDRHQAADQRFKVFNTQQIGNDWQAGPVNGAGAVGQHVPDLDGKLVVWIWIREVFALVLAGLQQGDQFFLSAALAWMCATHMSTRRWATR